MVQKVRAILWALGILMLLAAAFDVTTVPDNTMIFLAIACFVIGAVIKRACKKSESCCK
ncbi:MAG: hypothetical protein NT088_04495 [Candidatus Omnitrophica bacterium]|nr:hypothetical protein [Candidatus Omnitrophota bacterium]